MLAPRILGVAAAIALSTLALTACAGSSPSPETTKKVATPTEAPATEPDTDPTPQPTSASAPTCETLIAESVVADFESLGWTVQQSPLYINGAEVPDGLQCMWADFEGPAGDHGQMFGWAPLSATEAAATQEDLLAQGWKREEAAEGVYITEGAETMITADEEGYGITYLFADGYVTVADTKQGLLLIEWPQS